MKVGDKVKIIGESLYSSPYLQEGNTGIIVEIGTFFGEPGAQLKIDNAPDGGLDVFGEGWNFPQDVLEVISG